ncbi:SirB2 family protein [Vibrio sagamiensis]|uniref:Invasion protein n=1 Tax=Vibrio sagamiensis NBRC 104589 TaxID=1219064 RepID=A0A511QJH5_9VIBR|nr:SirB2 family protein [Vibrio sagamiensis]PNQ70573.1 hypothetical protein C1141_04575 [Vibrio agarivorans]GEM77431.1 hypothetical protein VSA01S_35430 [Vibrio sagamiensis NBRC 104589]
MYTALKHIHLVTIALSVTLLSLRFILMMMDSPKRNHKFLKIFPHIVDTALLLTGIGLIMVTGFMPFTEGASWLTNKLTCVLAYIALGFFALKLAKNKLLKTFAFFGALGWLVMAANIAVSKSPHLFG